MLEIHSIDWQREDVDLLNKPARLSHCPRAIIVGDGGIDLHINGKRAAVVAPMQHAGVKSFAAAARAVKYARERRLSGVYSGLNKTFGYMPSNGIFRRHCGVTAMFSHQRAEFVELCHQAAYASEFLKMYFPEEHSAAMGFLDKSVAACWRLPNSVFTGGIANKDNPIDYHKDKANAPGTLAVMASFRSSSVRGGWLNFPEYGVRLLLPNACWIAFPNSAWMHGVTPVQVGKGGGRYSVVFFTNERMASCGTPAEELKKARAHDMKKLKK